MTVTDTSDVVMAVVRVGAPRWLDPAVLEAELTRAINQDRKYPMTAELSPAAQIRTVDRTRTCTHGFVVVVRFGDGRSPEDLARRIRKRARHALKRRFGRGLKTDVRTDLTGAEAGAYWCTFRGTPHRPG